MPTSELGETHRGAHFLGFREIALQWAYLPGIRPEACHWGEILRKLVADPAGL